MKKGDKIKVLDSFDKPIDAVYMEKSTCNHHHVVITKPSNLTKNGLKRVDWYLPDSRY